MTPGVEAPDKITATAALTATSSGTQDGLAGSFSACFEAETGPGLTDAPFLGCAHRPPGSLLTVQGVLPFKVPLTIREGDVFRVTLTALSRSTLFAWHVRQLDPSGNARSLLKRTTLPNHLLSRIFCGRAPGTDLR